MRHARGWRCGSDVYRRRRPLPGRASRRDVPRGDQQVQRAIRTAKGDLHGQGLLPAPQRREVRHGPVQPHQLQQASHHPASLAQWQLEKDLDRQAELDGRIAKTPQADRACPHAARVRSYPRRPTSAKTPLAPRCVGAGPVRRAIAGGRWLAPAARLTAWIHKVNPTRQSSATTPMATIRLWPLVDPVSVSNVQS